MAAASAELARCVTQRGTGGGTDVFGALTQLANLTAPVHVMLVSDLVNTVGLDVTTTPLADPGQQAEALATVDARHLLPRMDGWEVDIVGGAFGTVALGPERSAQIQRFFQLAIESHGGAWKALTP